MRKKVAPIKVDMNADRLSDNLETYRLKALEMGADQARVIPAEAILVDERVVLKCRIPRCFGYGVCANCPPHTLRPAALKELLKSYRWAVLFIKEVPPEVIVRDKATIKERVAAYQQVFQIVSQLESLAFYDGHYLAFGLGAGSCKSTFCGQEETCAALEGKRCRFSLIARPSMEAVGLDVYKMVTQAGWDIYPIGSGAQPEDAPQGTLAGLVIVQ